MLERGVFGGAYFASATPADFEGLGDALPLALTQVGSFDKRANYYEVRAGETYEQWAAQGWLFSEDPLGWFHWYCRYHAGRRHHRDAHQIRRWVRHQDRWGRYARGRALAWGDCGPVVRQGLLQWALDPMVVLGLQESA
jgi:hypothetical protein